MSLTATLDTLVTMTFSAALPLFVLAAYQYRDAPFGGVLLSFPLFLLLGLGTLSLDDVFVLNGNQEAVTLALAGGAALVALFGAVRFFQLASGRRTV